MPHQWVTAPLSKDFVSEVAIGVAIKEVMPNRRHVGLFYDFDGESRFLHLGWHQDVRDQPFPFQDEYLGATFGIELDRIAKIALAGFLNAVEASIGLVPYGIDFDLAINAITPEATLAPMPLGKGMTCATFVAAVLNAASYMPIAPGTWSSDDPEDIEWQHWVIEMMEKTQVPQEHIAKVREDLGCKRLRPEQIAGACTMASWPVTKDDANEIAARVLADLAAIASASCN